MAMLTKADLFSFTNNGNAKANEKMKRCTDFINQVNSNDMDLNKIESIISSCKSYIDYNLLVKLIPVNENSATKLLTCFSFILYHILNKISPEEIRLNGVNDINLKLKEWENLINNNQHLLNDDKIDSIISSVGYKVNTLNRINNGITVNYVYYVTPKQIHFITAMNEAQSYDLSSDNMIISASKPKGVYTSVDVNYEVNPSDYIISLLKEDNIDYLIHKIHNLYDYIVSLKGKFDVDHTKAFISAINYVFSKVIDNITGKEKLLDVLGLCDKYLTDIIPTTDEYYVNINTIIEIMDHITDKINECPQGEVSIFDEMGIGYIYEILPKSDNEINDDNLNTITESLNLYVDNNDTLSILNESIKDKIKEKRDKYKERKKKDKEYKEKKEDEKYQLFDDTYDTRIDISRRKQTDEYDDERRKIDDKYDLKKQKKLDNYEFKKQKKLDKYEQKKSLDDEKRQLKDARREERHQDRRENAERRRQERLEKRQQKRDETKIGLNRWKTLELTNANVAKASRAVKRALTFGAAAGTGALMGLNPIFAGGLYMMGSFIKNGKNPRKQRIKYVDDLRDQIAQIDEKIEQADRNGENDKKIALTKMQRKLQNTLNRCSVIDKNAASGGIGRGEY